MAKISREKEAFKEKKQSEWERINIAKQIHMENSSKISKMKEDASDIIDLEVGGTHKLTTTKSTLTKYKNSVLAAMFSGKHELSFHKGRVFIDRDGQSFTHVISFLRTGKMPAFDSPIDE